MRNSTGALDLKLGHYQLSMSRINFFIGRSDSPNFQRSEVVGSYVATLVSSPKPDILRIGCPWRKLRTPDCTETSAWLSVRRLSVACTDVQAARHFSPVATAPPFSPGSREPGTSPSARGTPAIRPTPPPPTVRSDLPGFVVTDLVWLAYVAHHRQAGDGHPMAQPRLHALLVMAVQNETNRTTEDPA